MVLVVLVVGEVSDFVHKDNDKPTIYMWYMPNYIIFCITVRSGISVRYGTNDRAISTDVHSV